MEACLTVEECQQVALELISPLSSSTHWMTSLSLMIISIILRKAPHFSCQVFNDATNTNTIGNLKAEGTSVSNFSGQLPNQTTRRDSNGGAVTLDGDKYMSWIVSYTK